MKSIVFVCQRVQGMLKELVCAGEGDVIPPSFMHGKLQWSALHYILGVSQTQLRGTIPLQYLLSSFRVSQLIHKEIVH